MGTRKETPSSTPAPPPPPAADPAAPPQGPPRTPDPAAPRLVPPTLTPAALETTMARYSYSPKTRRIITTGNLLPLGLLDRLHATYPQHSALAREGEVFFPEPASYSGLEGFRRLAKRLAEHGISLGDLTERELFVEVYRFKVTRHILNTIDWQDYENDPLFQLTFPQPGMMRPDLLERYTAAAKPTERTRIATEYVRDTNPHDGHQLLNKPWLESDEGDMDLVVGSQHKYPPCMLVFDKSAQECFAFCTYCFRHAQVRGDEDMFVQDDVDQVHAYLREHPEVTDLLITGGDAGYMPVERLRRYVQPVMEDRRLLHLRTIRLGSRMLTYEPERVLTQDYEEMLALIDRMHDSGLQLTWVAHFSTPRELLNPSTIAAVRRLQRHGVVVRSQSPIMSHVSLFMDDQGEVDVERSAQNWIDLGNILGTLGIRFHSMYCARATGEHHYFTVPLADIDRIFSRIFRELSSLSRPSRYITMTTSAGKISILGVAEIGGRKVFALKFNESRNMEWMDRVFLAQYDETTNRVDMLQPFDEPEFFFEKELREIEQRLRQIHDEADRDRRPSAGQQVGSAERGSR
jgi:lysine 2,3-aminomutase